MNDLLVKWPSKARPQLFAETFQKWDAVPEACRFLISLDSDDPSLPAYRDILYGRANVRVTIGVSGSKVAACNRDLAGEPFDIVVLASDDMVPQRPDWAARLRALMAQHWPDGDGVLHLNDGRVGRTLNTLCVCDRKYFDRLGYLYAPHYRSVFCDDEWQEVSERLGRAVYVDEVLVAHQWVGQHAPDDLHRQNESHWHADARTFKLRQAAGFPR